MLLTNLVLAPMTGDPVIADGAALIENGLISWAGRRADAPAGREIDCGGRLVTPGLIDCHTHLVYAGNRAGEFEKRLKGVSYADIAKAGGGIMSTVRATRAADEAMLLSQSRKRLETLLDSGVTTVEIKSGYGLDRDTEMRMLRTAHTLGRRYPVDVVTTYLGAHALPPEFKDDRQGYIDLVCNDVMPAVHAEGLADAVDGFCEGIAFSVAEMEQVFTAARKLGLPVKLHAEQLANLGGAAMAARFGALSADHIEYLDEAGIAAMAKAGTVAVLLPGAFYYLREKQAPPVAGLRAARVPIAVATDLNPGSSPVHSMLAAMNMACVLFGLTPMEALTGATANAARALGLKDRGTIVPGMKADLVMWDVEQPAELAYPFGYNPLAAVIKNGKVVRGDLS